MKMPRSGSALAAVVLACAALLTGVGPAGVGPAAAGEPPTRTCAPNELVVKIWKGHSPRPDTDELFVITFMGRKGVNCLLGGAIDYIRFYDTSGRPLDVPFSDKAAVPPFDQLWVNDSHGPVVYISASKGDALPIGSMVFSVPTAPESEVKTGWPAPVSGPLHITKIMSAVS